MIEVRDRSLEQRVLVLAPTSRDSTLTASVLSQAGLTCLGCSNLEEICRELRVGAGVVLLPEEAVVPEQYKCLTDWLASQPPWSDLPLLVLARTGADSLAVARAMDLLGNVTVLERPARVAALVSSIRTALRARQRQYQIREHLEEHKRSEEALREADRRKDEFLAILAHELRNPLAPIRNALHLLRTSSPQVPADHVVEMMDRQVNHMVRLVDDLLEVSRISRGKIELRMEPIDIASVVHSAVETSRPLIEAGRHKLTTVIPAEPITLNGDFVRLTQVVANLLNNAAKYSDTGGQIWLTVRQDGDDVSISVRDRGQGIPPEKLSRVFDLFMQVDDHPSGTHAGLGIGLTLVKNLVEMHGGTVKSHSEGTGRGSEFVVRIPLGASRTPARSPAKAAAPTRIPSAPRVLVADDNHDAAESLALLLELLSADVKVVYSGVEVLDALATYKPTVVLLDIGMPGMDGLEVARRIRQLPESRDVTLIALTGWGQEEDRQRSESAGFDYHLTKPADLNALRNLLTSINRPEGTVPGAAEPRPLQGRRKSSDESRSNA